MRWVFFCTLCYMVAGEHFISREIKAIVLETMVLECHPMASRSYVELVIVCVSQDSCLGMKTNIDHGTSRMLCSCPNEPTWPDFTALSPASITHLRSRIYNTLPGKWLLIAHINSIQTFLSKLFDVWHVNKTVGILWIKLFPLYDGPIYVVLILLVNCMCFVRYVV